MKSLIYISAFLLCTSAFSQTEKEEAKEEVEIETVKVNNGSEIIEKKVKVITRETANVELAETDKNKVNQERINSVSKVEKMVMVDNNGDNNYELLTKSTFYKLGDKQYLFKPHDRGFDIAFSKEENKFVKTGSAYNTQNGNYLVDHKNYAGIGYFNENGDFTIEYFDKDKDEIVTKSYKMAQPSL